MWKHFVVILLQICALITDSKSPDEFKPMSDTFEFASEDANYTISDMERLINDKKAGYNKFVRPKIDQTKPVNIYASFVMSAFRELDEVNEKVSVGGGLLLIWLDERMTWNMSEYGGIRSFTIEQGEFWTPTLTLVNAYEKFEKIGADDYWLIRFTDFGRATLSPSDVFTATCSVDVTFYPWDTQYCKLQFAFVSQVSQEVQIFVRDEKIDTSYFVEHGEWDIIDSKLVPVYDNIALDVRMTLKRKPLFIIVNIVLPVIFLSALKMLVFLIPTESGERFSYGMTVLLAIAVFLTIISDNLPKSGKNIPVLCYYLVGLLVYGIIIMFGTTVSMRIYFTSEDEDVPIWCARLVRLCSCRKRKRLKTTFNNNEQEIITRQSRGVEKRASQNANDSNREYSRKFVDCKYLDDSRTSSNQTSQPMTPTSSENVSVTWKDVSRFLDIIFFNLSWVTLTVFTTAFFTCIKK